VGGRLLSIGIVDPGPVAIARPPDPIGVLRPQMALAMG
jgi:hypothetical protein